MHFLFTLMRLDIKLHDDLSDMRESPQEVSWIDLSLAQEDLVLRYISKMIFILWKTPGVSERMWSVNLEASSSGEYQTLGEYSGRPSD
jgi:hypothetical protein